MVQIRPRGFSRVSFRLAPLLASKSAMYASCESRRKGVRGSRWAPVPASSVDLRCVTVTSSMCQRFRTSGASQRLKEFKTRFSFAVTIVSHRAVNCYIYIHGINQSIHFFFVDRSPRDCYKSPLKIQVWFITQALFPLYGPWFVTVACQSRPLSD